MTINDWNSKWNLSKSNDSDNRVASEPSGEDTKVISKNWFFMTFVLFNSPSSVLYWIKDLLMLVKLIITIHINLATVGKMRHKFEFSSTTFDVDI